MAEMGHIGARLMSKKNSTLMHVCAFLLRPFNPDFMSAYWTTIGRTIYYPTGVTHPILHSITIEHELVHIRQWRKYGLWLWFSYLFVPFPIFIAWYRWRWEREAYMVDIRAGVSIDAVVASLWHGYGWPWPRESMRRWFWAQKGRTI